MWPFSLQKYIEASHNSMTRQTFCNTFFYKLCTVFLSNTELMDKDYIFLHTKPWIVGGEKSIFMVVIH